MNRITGALGVPCLAQGRGHHPSVRQSRHQPNCRIMHALKDHPDLTYVMAMQERPGWSPIADGLQPRLGPAGSPATFTVAARARQCDGLAVQCELLPAPR